MGKILVFSKEVYFDYLDGNQFDDLLSKFIDDNNKIVFISRDNRINKDIKKYFVEKNIKVYVKTRDEIKDIMVNHPNEVEKFIIIGNRDKDFETAVNNKLLYIVPMWCNEICEKCEKYGVKINNLIQLEEIINTVNNHHNWYYHEKLEDGTEVYSLTSGNSRLWNVTSDEKELVDGFQKFLKQGKVDYYEILFYHFLAGISNLKLFKEIDMWGIAPSSGTSLSKEMMEFKDKARCLMKKRYAKEGENLFLRYTPIKQSKYLGDSVREEQGAGRLLGSIYLNPDYSVKGKVVCIFDDYLTHGNTFEAMRNILKIAKAKKIIFVSLGRFKKDYIYQNYDIKGDVTTPNGFTFKEITRTKILYRCNDKARREVENLHKIFNL